MTSLTQREQQVLDLILNGDDTATMCRVLSITRNTLKRHTQHVCDKKGQGSRGELMAQRIKELQAKVRSLQKELKQPVASGVTVCLDLTRDQLELLKTVIA